HGVHRGAGPIGGGDGDDVGRLLEAATVEGEEAERRAERHDLVHTRLGEQLGEQGAVALRRAADWSPARGTGRRSRRIGHGRRRMGWSSGTSITAMASPSGSAIHISRSPHGSVTGARRTSTPFVRSSAWASSTERTWNQRRTAELGRSGGAPDGPCDTSRYPPPRKNTVPRSPHVPNSRKTASPSVSP